MSAIDFALEVLRQLSEVEDYSEIGCPDCRGRLVIHQPDERLPERLLGTCRSCLSWFLIDAAAGVVLRLADEMALARAEAVPLTGPLDRPAVAASGPRRLDGPENVAGKGRRRRGLSMGIAQPRSAE